MAHHHSHRTFPHDDDARRKWQDPEAILFEIGLEPGMVFADIGAGGGFFAIPAARMVGERGKVYALDINAESIGSLAEAARTEGLGNVIAQVGAGEDTVLCEACADVVFFGIDLHDFADAGAVLLNARAMVKPGGRLVDLDWKKEPMELGPPYEIRFDEKEAARLIVVAGFTVETIKGVGPLHYVVIARPSPDS